MAVFFPWLIHYVTGIAAIDTQHKALVDMLNDLFSSMPLTEDREVERQMLEKIFDYTKTHFAVEEKLLLRYDYPDIEAHKLEHEKLKAEVIRFQEALRLSKTRITVQTATFLKDWLKEHILKTDMQYVPFLKSKGVK
jgi:hemerythrin